MRRLLFFYLVLFLLFSGLSGYSQKKDLPYIILVSFDGFRHDYVERFNLPNFKAFIKNGSQTEALMPCYPSMTFPNHYSTVTGLYPGNHGLIDNTFYDPNLDSRYSMNDRSKVTDPVFYGGVPIWKLARQAGMITASYFWIGSEVTDQESRPNYYYEYDGSVSFQSRVEKVMNWLALPEAERPRMIMLYFSSPDYESHMHGPWAPETKRAVLQADSLLGYMMTRIKETSLPVNVLLTSDHGLTEITVQRDTYVYLDQIINVDDSTYTLVNNGTHAHIYTKSEKQADSLFRLLQAKQTRFKVYMKEDLPDTWHYQHERVGDVFIAANYPHYLRNKPGGFLRDGKPGTKRGVHGYDPDVLTDMHGIFYASGPNIKRGVKLNRIRNIDVFQLMVSILNLKAPDVDGSPVEILKVYRKN
jgi:predicted AlkP superfamily pyrophosphatase or phosphodiesterase